MGMDIVLTQIESVEDSTAEQAHRVYVAARVAEAPDIPPICWESFRGRLVHPWPNRPASHFLARLDGAPAGCLTVVLPDLDNIENAYVEVFVHPSSRRRGVGRRLVERAVTLARQSGRSRLIGGSVATLATGSTGGESGTAFANSVGAKPALTETRRRLDLSTVDDSELTELLARAWLRAEGYSLVWFRDIVPGELLPDIAYLDSRISKDVPTGDLTVEPELMDTRRIRAAEATSRARKQRRYSTGVRHDASGQLVAVTRLDLDHCPADHAWQQITMVDPRHRGRGLGTIAKIENLRYARIHEPALRYIDTWNADSNGHMIAINERLGFRPVDKLINWQIDL